MKSINLSSSAQWVVCQVLIWEKLLSAALVDSFILFHVSAV